MDFDKITEESRRVELDMTASIIEHTLDSHNVSYQDIVPLYQYNKVAVHGVSDNINQEVAHTLLDYDIILEGVTKVTSLGGVNVFFREVTIEEVEVLKTENHIIPSM